jgi:hypothetical protein
MSALTPKAVCHAKSGLGQFLQIIFACAAGFVLALFPPSDAMVNAFAALNVYALWNAIVPHSKSSGGNE